MSQSQCGRSPSQAGYPSKPWWPLPHHQADRPRAHPSPKNFPPTPMREGSYPVLITVSGGYPKVKGRLLTCYSPVRRSSTTEVAFPLDLHVLSTPPAFVLSQDQTLHRKHTPTNPPTKSRPARKKRATSPDKRTNTDKKKLSEIIVVIKETTTTKQPPHPKAQDQITMSTGQNKLIRRLSDTLLSSQKSDAPTSRSA